LNNHGLLQHRSRVASGRIFTVALDQVVQSLGALGDLEQGLIADRLGHRTVEGVERLPVASALVLDCLQEAAEPAWRERVLAHGLEGEDAHVGVAEPDLAQLELPGLQLLHLVDGACDRSLGYGLEFVLGQTLGVLPELQIVAGEHQIAAYDGERACGDAYGELFFHAIAEAELPLGTFVSLVQAIRGEQVPAGGRQLEPLVLDAQAGVGQGGVHRVDDLAVGDRVPGIRTLDSRD
jgi:hypothetical protein